MSQPPRPGTTRRDELVRTLSADGTVSVRTVVATNLVHQLLARREELSTTSTAVLGRCLMGSILLAAGGKGESVQIRLQGDGVMGAIMAVSDPDGRARGYAAHPEADPRDESGEPDLRAAIGAGTLTVSRRRQGWKEPQSGTVPIEFGEIARDLTLYLMNSEQVPSAVGLALAFDEDRFVSAGGFVVQAMPGADDDDLARVEENVLALSNLTGRVRSGVTADGLVDLLLAGAGSRRRHRLAPEFFCPCTRMRALRTLTLLGADELREIVEGGQSQEVRCEICGERYELLPGELSVLVADLA